MRTNLTIAIVGLAVLAVAGCSPRVEPTSPVPPAARTSGATARPGTGTATAPQEFDNRMNQQSSAMADAMRKRNAAQSGK